MINKTAFHAGCFYVLQKSAAPAATTPSGAVGATPVGSRPTPWQPQTDWMKMLQVFGPLAMAKMVGGDAGNQMAKNHLFGMPGGNQPTPAIGTNATATYDVPSIGGGDDLQRTHPNAPIATTAPQPGVPSLGQRVVNLAAHPHVTNYNTIKAVGSHVGNAFNQLGNTTKNVFDNVYDTFGRMVGGK